MDIGGSLIKMVYFSNEDELKNDVKNNTNKNTNVNADKEKCKKLGGKYVMSKNKMYFSKDKVKRISNKNIGKLHFVKFQTSELTEAISFIKDKNLLRHGKDFHGKKSRILVTGGGAYKYSDIFFKELGVYIEKQDEMESLVFGCNFLLNAIPDESFTYINRISSYVKINGNQ